MSAGSKLGAMVGVATSAGKDLMNKTDVSGGTSMGENICSGLSC
jgi:hypothetical protein